MGPSLYVVYSMCRVEMYIDNTNLRLFSDEGNPAMKVFLGGTCESDWRDNFIPLLDIEYFNPIVENWTEACKAEELKQRQTCDFLLYVITPSMKGVYSIAEVTDDSNKKPHRTILVVLKKDDGETFSSDETKSLKAVQELVERNGGQVFNSLKPAADWINQEATAMTYAREETVDGRQVELCVDDIEGALTEVGSLESLLEAIEESRDVGMEAWSAQFAKIHVNGVMRRYRLDPCNVSLPAMESFYDTRRARLATSVSVESVKETIEKIWEWIKEQFLKLKKLAVEFYDRLMRSLDHITREADRYKQYARHNKFEGGKPINLGHTGAKITIQGKIATDFISNLNTVGALARISDETLTRIREECATTLDKLLSGESYTPRQEVLVPSGWMRGKTNQQVGVTEIYVSISPELPGDRAIVVSTFGENNDDSASTLLGTKVTYQVKIIDSFNGVKDTNTVSLDSNEVFSLCQRITKTVASLKTSREDIMRHLASIDRTFEEVKRRHADDSTAAGKVIHSAAAWVMRQGCVYGTALQKRIDQVVYDVCIGYLHWAQASIKAHATTEAPFDASLSAQLPSIRMLEHVKT